MENKKYQNIVKKHTKKENKFKNLVVAFIIGGIIGVIGESLIELYTYFFNISTKTASTFMIITLIFVACLCTALGFFDNFVKFGKMGVIIPITGFAHSMQSASLDYKHEGLVYGFGANMFRLAGTVILYGVVSAYLFGIIRLIITEVLL